MISFCSYYLKIWDANNGHITFAQEQPCQYYTVICPDYIDGFLQNLWDFDHSDMVPWRLYPIATCLILQNVVDKRN